MIKRWTTLFTIWSWVSSWSFPHDVQWGQLWKVNNCYLMWLPPHLVKSSPHELMSIFLPAISKMIPNILHSWQYSDWWKWGLILPNSPYMALKLTHKTPIISPTCIQARQSSSLIEWWGTSWQGDPVNTIKEQPSIHKSQNHEEPSKNKHASLNRLPPPSQRCLHSSTWAPSSKYAVRGRV